ncbi:hypothetical protein WR25_07189 isoform D [Diploscapter pachys]|nr:hypothetical protein WR25_07189 isoform D [Diploscapter pachys]
MMQETTNTPVGTYIISSPSNNPADLTLSIIISENPREICHYFIDVIETNGITNYSIGTDDQAQQRFFRSLKDLVRYYSDYKDPVLNCKLTVPGLGVFSGLNPENDRRVASPVQNIAADENNTAENIVRFHFLMKFRLILELYSAHLPKFGIRTSNRDWKLWNCKSCKILSKFRFNFQVYEGKLNNTKVAIKVPKAGILPNELIVREITALLACRHKNIVRMFGAYTFDTACVLVFEFMSGGSLQNYLKDQRKAGLVPNTLVLMHIAFQIAEGMIYIENHNMVHRDLATRNILLGEKIDGIPIAKISDFGLARQLNDGGVYQMASDLALPARWYAPETFQTYEFTIQNDVWSFGVLLFEMFTFGNTPPKVRHNERLRKPQHCCEYIYNDIMMSCWKQEPALRPSFSFLRDTILGYLTDFFGPDVQVHL